MRAYSLKIGPSVKAKPRGTFTKNSIRVLALVVCLIAALVGLTTVGWQLVGTSRTLLKPGEASVVVLPFANLSGDASQDYVVKVLTDGLTDAVSHISGFFVIANRTAMTYQGKQIEPKQIGKDLNVHFVLEGSIQPSPNGVRVNVQLIDTETGVQVWADRFDQERTDLMQMEDDIVARLARDLDVRLADVEAARATRVRPDNPRAQDLADRCYANIMDNQQGWDMRTRAALYEPCHRALALDPRNTLALKLNAVELVQGIDRGSVDKAGDLKRAREWVQTALAIDVNDPGVHNVNAFLLLAEGRPDQAIAEAQRSLDLNPSFMLAYITLCPALTSSGQPLKGIECLDREMRLSPRDPQTWSFQFQKAEALQVLGRDSEALDWTQKSLTLQPGYPKAALLEVALLANLGRDGEAPETLQNYSGSTSDKQFKTIGDYEAHYAGRWPEDRAILKSALERRVDGLRKAGLPEE